MLKLLKEFHNHIENLKPSEVIVYGFILGMLLIAVDPLGIIRGM